MSKTTLAETFVMLLKERGAHANDDLYDYLWTVDRTKLKRRLDRLRNIRDLKIEGNSKASKAKRGKKSRLIGLAYEYLVKFLLKGGQVISYESNIRTTTNEVDFILKIEPLSNLVPVFREAGTHIIGEAKCYTKAPKVEWADELVGIMDNHSARVAILFLGCEPKELKREIRISIALHARGNKFIIPIGLKQIEDIVNGANFIKIFADQGVAVKNHKSKVFI